MKLEIAGRGDAAFGIHRQEEISLSPHVKTRPGYIFMVKLEKQRRSAKPKIQGTTRR
ncbi:MAG TPA: hypothetical protein VGO69_05475 [Pyrinomonadaceae bacterium]|nr:hypothetical protein [Pyrinomonadaceae bacterium]